MKQSTREMLVFLGAGLLVILIAAGPKICWLLRSKGWLLIASVMVLFSLLGSTMGFSVETLGFYALFMPLMAALGYDSALVLADAIRRAGSTEPAKVRDALAATRNLEGVSGRTTIDAQRNASKPAVIVEVRNGSFRFVQTVEP